MNFKESYQRYNEEIQPAESLIEGIKAVSREQEKYRKRRGIRVARRVVEAVAVCLCLCITMPVLAANVEPVYRLMYLASPRFAQFFKPVQKADEDQGIRMEVLAAYVHDNEIQAYITLQDLEGDRIDETTDLSDSYSINTPFSGYGSCQRIGYDAETGIVTFLVTVGQLAEDFAGGQDISGDKITFSVREFISGKISYDGLEIPIPLSEVKSEPETMMLFISGGTGPNMISKDLYDEDGNYVGKSQNRYADMLLPGEPDERFPVEGIWFTGMGYIDGMLHVQTAVPDNLENDNHGEIFLVNRNGNQRIYDYKIGGWGGTEETRHIMYQDCIFDISPEKLENYTLQGDFVTSGFHMEGNWSVTFPLE